MKIALGIEYEGTGFLGWQTQPGGGAVQDALEAALSGIAAAPVRTVCAGRTDRGVHACGQVVHFETSAVRPPAAWVRGVNAMLPPSIAVRWSTGVADEFHARYSAIARSYRYVLLNRRTRPALAASRAGWFHDPLDAGAMQEAAACLAGAHDFSSFRSSECQARSPVRTVERIEVRRHGERIDFFITANAFLHHMVRNIVGSLVYVGAGRQQPAWLGDLLDARDRTLAAPTFAPQGLYLESVRYGAQWRLPDAQGACAELVSGD